ncbi:alpha/beta fold hydrolase BchO [Gemmatimonas sp.]|uniref:alpha/beta fold hydrolase BchO n=1 Tax=Gemmatimonas sp. TaxID=1962908 RepID=UPI00356819F2
MSGFTDLPPADWPFRATSRLLEVDGIRWHFQQFGQGPALLLVHGTGGSVHSWSHGLEALARTFSITAIDLPGHGFTTVPPEVDRRRDVYSLQGMARSCGELLRAIDCTPALVAGHSAGVAVLLRAVLDGRLAPARIVGFNPALVPPPPFYVTLVAPLLRPFFESDVVADGGAWVSRNTRLVRQLIGSSGTELTAADLARYELLCARPQHVHAALTMMSRWDLPGIVRDAVALDIPLELIAGGNDRWVPYRLLERSVARLPRATLRAVAGAGHLLPEERPDEIIASLIAHAGEADGGLDR